MSLSLTFAAIGLFVTAAVAMREHAKAVASRRGLLDSCAGLLSNAVITHGGDGFPRLKGLHNGRLLHVELLPDTMTIRRLPQLWLKLTLIDPRPGLPEFSLLVRPTGAEFYSLTHNHARMLEPPLGVPSEILAKGDGKSSQQLLNRVAPVLRRIFSDPRMKEVAATGKGLRLVWQAGEGDRGHHLLLRQSRFGDASVAREALAARLKDFDDLSAAIDTTREVQAA
ncbi:hypothetical protein [Hyphomicrobium sp.]|uniref:hypothetical protein n=1 Tax=Hyphomicrobium sp. TaxID=82 RepID=UPI002D77BAD9|nr:hypothetical protein [Hyphomicrobium sp.]HET6390437.1 hypothetical protein [Hyphomicrobium sp.]